jgi:phosphoribosylformimino-5-aminoimidazole carboxamide ribotide isomerase
MQGVNVEATVRLAQSVRIPVIASGGVTNLADVEALCAVESEGVSAAILGRALYEGALSLAEAQARADQLTGSDAGR